MSRIRVLSLSLLLAVVVSTPVQAVPMFIGLGDVPGSLDRTAAYGVSADGLVVVGDSLVSQQDDHQAFRWENGQLVDLVEIGKPFSTGRDSSANGSVVVGISLENHVSDAWVWENGAVTFLGAQTNALAVSDDGTVVVGRSSGKAIRWTSTGGIVQLLDENAIAGDVSGDGSVIVGTSLSIEAWRWTDANGVEDLGSLPGPGPQGPFQAQRWAFLRRWCNQKCVKSGRT